MSVPADEQSVERIVVCVDMWGSIATRQPVEDGLPYVERYLHTEAHNQLVLEVFCKVRDGFKLKDASVLKMLGDGLLLTFPIDSVLASLVFAVGVLNRLSAKEDSPIERKSAIALSCGLVSMRAKSVDGQTPVLLDIRGYPVDVAARLVSVAEAGQVLLCGGFKQRITWPADLRGACTTFNFGPDFIGSIPASVGLEPDSPRAIRLPASGDPLDWYLVDSYQLKNALPAATEATSVVVYEGVPKFSAIRNRHVRRQQLLLFHDTVIAAANAFDDKLRYFTNNNTIMKETPSKTSLAANLAGIEAWNVSLELRNLYTESEELRYDRSLRTKLVQFERAIADLFRAFGAKTRAKPIADEPAPAGYLAKGPDPSQGTDRNATTRDTFVNEANARFEDVAEALRELADLCNGELRGLYEAEEVEVRL